MLPGHPTLLACQRRIETNIRLKYLVHHVIHRGLINTMVLRLGEQNIITEDHLKVSCTVLFQLINTILIMACHPMMDDMQTTTGLVIVIRTMACILHLLLIMGTIIPTTVFVIFVEDTHPFIITCHPLIIYLLLLTIISLR